MEAEAEAEAIKKLPLPDTLLEILRSGNLFLLLAGGVSIEAMSKYGLGKRSRSGPAGGV